MIKIDDNKTIIAGELDTILTEATIILNKIYTQMKTALGEKQANEYMVEIGRFAIMSEDEVLKGCRKS